TAAARIRQRLQPRRRAPPGRRHRAALVWRRLPRHGPVSASPALRFRRPARAFAVVVVRSAGRRAATRGHDRRAVRTQRRRRRGRFRLCHARVRGYPELMYGLARPFLFGLDAERAHGLGLASLEAAYRSGLSAMLARHAKPLPTRAFGLTFRNPVGLAAGLDKNGA